MRYSFGDYILDTKLELLFANEKRVDLEPKQYSTLLLLCQHQNEIVSRERLLEVIWNGVIVSENTINKHIAGVRKLLSDNAKSPRYIETVPRKGYRFIGNPTLIAEKEDDSENKHSSEQHQPNNPLAKFLVTTSIIFVVIASFWWDQDLSKAEDIQTLTRMEGDKRSINFYKDDVHIVFINQREHASELFVQNIEDLHIQKISHEFDFISLVASNVGEDNLHLIGRRNGKVWLARGKVLNNTFSIDSQFDISGFKVFDIDYDTDSSSLYIIAQSLSTRDRGLYKIVSTFDNIEPLYIPENEDVLFTRVDSDPNKQALLILGQLPNSHSSVFSFSPKSKSIQKLHEFDSLIRDVVWHHEHVLYTDTPPAQRILELQPNASIEPQVIATSSEYLCCEMLFSESTEQLIYRTNTTNFHIDWVRGAQWTIDNSTVYDMLPSMFHQTEGVAFVSKRSGKSQIYHQEPHSELVQLSDFSRYHVIRALDVSPNDSHVIAIVDNTLFLKSINSQNARFKKTFKTSSWLQDVRWLNEKHFVVRHSNKGTSWLEVYDVELNSIRKLATEWQQVFTDQQDSTSWFAVHQFQGLVQLEPVVLEQNTELVIEITLNSSVQARGKILKDGQFFYQQASRKELVQFDSSGKPHQIYPFRRIYGFDVSQSKIIASDLKYQTSDWHSKRLN